MKSKEIELTELSQEAPDSKVEVPITFCTHVGWDGALLLLFPLEFPVCLFISLFCTQKAFKRGTDRGFGSLWC